MNKRGQFYLITAIIIVALILAFATISNELKKEDFKELESDAEELEIESQAVLDYVAYNNEDFETFLLNFTESYANYTEAENIYFIFGNFTKITVAAQQKNYPGRIFVNENEMLIEQDTYTSQSFNNPSDPTNIIINEITHEFDIREGDNFYFIISEGEEEGNYFFTGSVISNDHE